ncbi:MAG: TetR/AcrR family transcriptional regulator [Gemmatimonadaceae bacterium]
MGNAPETENEPRRRKDALENRERLLTSAVEAFTRDANAPLDGIARAAGVGIGTLYRHFPTREALIEEAYRNELEKLTGAAPELLRDHDPDAAMREMMNRFIDYVGVKRGLADALRAVVAGGGNPYNQSRARLTESMELLLTAGQQSGVFRTDINAEDLMSMAGMFLNIGDDVAKARRMAAVLVDGLQAR